VTEETTETAPAGDAKPIRIGRINSLARCRRAVTRITRAVLAGEIATKRARVAIAGMREVRACLELEVIEVGLRELEARVGEREGVSPSSTAYQELTGLRKRRAPRLLQ